MKNNMPYGPCIKCGLTNYPSSMGGYFICPSCDCGNPPRTFSQAVDALYTLPDKEFEQILKDANFDFYNKIGAPVYSIDEAIDLVTKQSNQIPSRLFRGTRGVRTKWQEKY